MFVPVWFTHAWSTGEGDLLGAYLHCTATTPFETVCKQFINGSVPFSYSLNSGFDTGNDSWFSTGAWQVGTPVQKCLQVQVLCGWQRAGDPEVEVTTSRWVWLSENENIPLHLSKSWGGKRERSRSGATVLRLQMCSPNMHTITYSAKIWREGGAGHFNPGDAIQLTQRLPHQWPLTSSPSHEKEKTRSTAWLDC